MLTLEEVQTFISNRVKSPEFDLGCAECGCGSSHGPVNLGPMCSDISFLRVVHRISDLTHPPPLPFMVQSPQPGGSPSNQLGQGLSPPQLDHCWEKINPSQNHTRDSSRRGPCFPPVTKRTDPRSTWGQQLAGIEVGGWGWGYRQALVCLKHGSTLCILLRGDFGPLLCCDSECSTSVAGTQSSAGSCETETMIRDCRFSAALRLTDSFNVNECEETNGGCEALCCNTIGSFYCKCPSGQELKEDGKTCQDVDECQVHNGGCQHRCVNTRGSYRCECNIGSRLHVDARTCIGSRVAQGVGGVGGMLNEAVSGTDDRCACTATRCVDRWLTMGTRVKERRGLSLYGLMEPCITARGSSAWVTELGQAEDVMHRPCLLQSVQSCGVSNGGCEQVCVQLNPAQFQCRCRHNYELAQDGKRCTCECTPPKILCAIHTVNAMHNPCSDKNGGCMHRCQNDGGRVRCDCHPGYRLAADGKACEDIDECQTGKASCAHGCRNTRGSFICTCDPGYELGADSRQCYRIEMEIVNSCETDNGGCSHHCQHSTAGPVCSCNHGYQLGGDSRTCVDVDECGAGKSCCEQDCTNYPGGYECYCRAGYRLSKDGCSCDDVDECLSDNGGCDHNCQNNAGSFQCLCHRGYRLDEDRRSCLPLEGAVEALGSAMEEPDRPLLQLTLLQDSSQGPGRYGDYEEEPVRLGDLLRAESSLTEKFVCLNHTFGHDCSLTCEDCSNGGGCTVGRDGCDCPSGWNGVICNQTCAEGTFGKNCSTPCKCKNGASCDPVTGFCRCPPGVSGELCQDGEVLSEMPAVRQTDAGTLFLCYAGCPKGLYGKHCNKKCNCANNGRCHRTYGACLCDPGLYGRFCHLQCPKWAFGPGCSEECRCVQQNTQECHRRHGTCICKPGYHGDTCKEECSVGFYGLGCKQKCKCPPGVLCNHVTGSCQPQCPAGRQGEDCSQGRCSPPEHQWQCSVTECTDGSFGVGCTQSCDCSGSPCDKVTGQCRCPAGTTGERCEKVCVDGYWGQGCKEVCPACENGGVCDKQNGTCHCPPGYMGRLCQNGVYCPLLYGPIRALEREREGERKRLLTAECSAVYSGRCHPVTGRCTCASGWTGHSCTKACDAGRWGVGCANTCDCRNSDGGCDAVTGQCLCEPGFTGTRCDQKCPQGSFGPGCRHQCQCDNQAACDHVSGACTCLPGWTGTFSCPQGFFGLECREKCVCLNGGRCDHLTGACLCSAGWVGLQCNLSSVHQLLIKQAEPCSQCSASNNRSKEDPNYLRLPQQCQLSPGERTVPVCTWLDWTQLPKR
ncbi:hypothetical protein JZ751_017501 [Albula glossodonta]|uniref:Multiple epidermal growth factor-like domains protein 6 n=1 Tax=Albula glossodonta TaxID=121402 RepID=A0A8T2PK72_9TELE|nr:hypothetical protein JZ751_017501 [Albula glossodonta]